ncbi:MAG: glycoside hydrolase family 3 protein [Treponemataceae bacterium]|nr:glycoside hydrolase family 3 protein [Treponemataceae bacterium]
MNSLFCAMIFSTLVSCRKVEVEKKSDDAESLQAELERQKNSAIEEYIFSLSECERLAQIFVVNIEGNEEFCFCEYMDDGSEKKSPLIPGGYIFFSFNIAETPEKIAAFTDSVRRFAHEQNCAEPFLCLDAEGGFVNRLRGLASPLPEAARVAECLSPSQAERLYSLNAIQLKSLGFDLNFAPVCETLTSENEKFLDGRSFGDAEAASEYSCAAIKSYQQNRVGAVAKHFPGNGNADPHARIPRVFFEAEDFQKNVLEPFEKILGENPAGILMSHAFVELGENHGEDFSKSGELPASLSAFWIQDILREKLGFDGIVFSDDIFMSALEQSGFDSERAVHEAILAGVNCILMSEKRFLREYKIVRKFYSEDAAFRSRADDSIRKIVKFKIDCGILRYEYDESQENETDSPPRMKIVPSEIFSENESGENSFLKRMEKFSAAKEEGFELYEKYFLPTASKEELRAVRWTR